MQPRLTRCMSVGHIIFQEVDKPVHMCVCVAGKSIEPDFGYFKAVDVSNFKGLVRKCLIFSYTSF